MRNSLYYSASALVLAALMAGTSYAQEGNREGVQRGQQAPAATEPQHQRGQPGVGKAERAPQKQTEPQGRPQAQQQEPATSQQNRSADQAGQNDGAGKRAQRAEQKRQERSAGSKARTGEARQPNQQTQDDNRQRVQSQQSAPGKGGGNNATDNGAGPAAPNVAADNAARSGAASRPAQLSAQQRNTIRERIVLRGGAVRRGNNVNLNVRVGGQLPRTVALSVLPAVIIADIPEYRTYRYAIVDDEILIVEPSTYQVVEVIGRAPSGQQAASLELSSEHRHLVFETVHKQAAISDVRARLALGAAIGPDVTLERFPTRVVHTIPELDLYRFVVTRDEVLIVEPASREIVLIVNE